MKPYLHKPRHATVTDASSMQIGMPWGADAPLALPPPPSEVGFLLPFGYGMIGAKRKLEYLRADPQIVLADVRMSTNTQRVGWSGRELAQAWGERYLALPQLGNRHYKSSGHTIVLASPEEGYPKLIEALRGHRAVVVLCSCARYDWCHRKVVCEEVVRRVSGIVIRQPEEVRI